MERDAAVRFLREDCLFDPQLTEQEAEDLWLPYRRSVEDLGKRAVKVPAQVSLKDFEMRRAAEFMRFFRGLGSHQIIEVIKIDPMSLIVHQLYVVMSRSDGYRASLSTSAAWINKCLVPALPPPRNVSIRAAINHHDVGVPHMEFGLTFDSQSGFRIAENPNYVTVCGFEGGNRMLLWAGYHRSFARMVITADDAMERSLLMVLTTDADLLASANSPNQGLRDMICGERPPFFADFFDTRFFMTVPLRKKRYELQIRAQIVPIDDPT